MIYNLLKILICKVQRHLKTSGLDHFSQTKSDVLLNAICTPVSLSQPIIKGPFTHLGHSTGGRKLESKCYDDFIQPMKKSVHVSNTEQ